MFRWFLCVSVFLWFSVGGIGAELSLSEIGGPLDEEGFGDGLWVQYRGDGGYTLEEVPDPDSVGGTVLKVTVEAGQAFTMKRLHTPADGRISFRFKHGSGPQVGIHPDRPSDYFELPDMSLPVEGVSSGVWTEHEILWKAYVSDFGFWVNTGEGETCVFYLDEVRMEERFALRTEGVGVGVDLSPAKEFYDLGERVQVTVRGVGDGIGLASWENVEHRHETYTMTVTEHDVVGAVGGREFRFGEVGVLAPLSWELMELVESEEDGAFLRVHTRGDRERLIVFCEGPGVLKLWARKSSGAGRISSNSFMRQYLKDEKVEFSFAVGDLASDFGIELAGKAEIGGIEFHRGYRVLTETDGEGVVTLSGGDEVVAPGTVLSAKAEPAEGWLFYGWEGDFASRESELAFEVSSEVNLKAVFYREVDFGGISGRLFGAPDWAISGEGDSLSLDAPVELQPGEESRIVWTLEGVGEFSIDYQTDSSYDLLYVNGQNVSGGYGFDKSYRKEFGPGRNTVELRIGNYSGGRSDIVTKVKKVSWDPGYALSVPEPAGGAIEGLPDSLEAIPYGTRLRLRAVPEDGFEFFSWRGISDISEASEFELVVSFDYWLEAVFGKRLPEGHFWDAEMGAIGWQLAEGAWSAPAMLGEGEWSGLQKRITGPARVAIRFEEGRFQGRYRLNGELRGEVASDLLEVDIPEGEHDFIFEAFRRSGEEYAAPKIEDAWLSYPVEIEVVEGSLLSDPQLEKSDDSNVWSGYVRFGEELSVEVSGEEGALFSGWVGVDLSAEKGEIAVDGAVVAQAVFEIGKIVLKGIDWTVSPVNSAYAIDGERLSLWGDRGEVELEAVVEGPKLISFSDYGLKRFEVLIDGEKAATAHAYSSAYLIPEGRHSIKLKLEPDYYGDDSYYNHPRNYVRYGIRSIRLSDGFPAYLGIIGAGNVKRSPSLPGYEKGTEVMFTAEPTEGNRFSRWLGDFEGLANPVNWEIDAVVSAIAAFEVDGDEWTFEGGRPSFVASQQAGFEDGFLLYTLFGDDRNEPRSVSGNFAGPGWVWFGKDYADLTEGEGDGVRLFVDGIELENRFSRIFVQEGEHSFRWEIEPDLEEGGVTFFRAGFPNVENEFQVNASAENATIVFSEEKERYAIGEAVRVSAPETNEYGHAFKGWWNSGESRLLSLDRELELVVGDDVSVKALYGGPALEVEGGVVWSNKPQGGGWSKTGDVFTALDYALLKIGVLERALVTFEAKVEGSQAHLNFSRTDGWHFAEAANDGEFHAYQVSLDEGESLEFDFRKSGRYGQGWVRNISVEKKWGPTIVTERQEGDEIVLSEESAELPDGSELVATAKPGEGRLFVGWQDSEGRVVSKAPVTLIVGDPVDLKPIFSDLYPENELFEIFGEILGWEYSSESGTWTFDAPEVSEANALKIRFKGPGELAFIKTGGYFGGPADVLFDGEIVDEGSGNRLSGAEGEHVVEILPTGGLLNVSGIDFVPGVRIRESGSSRGQVATNAVDGFVPPNEDLTAVAIPGVGYEFKRWKEPFEDMPIEFTVPIDEYVELEAVFQPVRESEAVEKTEDFRAWGIDWRVHNANWWLEGDHTSDIVSKDTSIASTLTFRGLGGVQSSHVDASVEGPLVLRFDSLSAIQIDGTPLVESEMLKWRDDSSYLIAVPEGRHTIRFGVSSTSLLLGENFEILEGYYLDLKGVGMEVATKFGRSVFRKGELVELVWNEDLPSSEIEWIGLPADAVRGNGSVTFRMEDHLSVRAFSWVRGLDPRFSMMSAGNSLWDLNYGWRYTGRAGESCVAIKAESEGDGYVKFSARVSNHVPAVVRVWLNGVELESFRARLQRDESLTFYVRTENAEDEVVVVFEPHKSWSGSVLQLSIHDIDFIPDAERPSYLEYWDDVYGGNSNRIGSVADYDGDGIPNFVELGLGLDLLREDRFVEFVYEDGVGFVRYLKLSDELRERFAIEHADSLYGLWEDADYILGDIESDPISDKHERRRVIGPSHRKTMYFRSRFELGGLMYNTGL